MSFFAAKRLCIVMMAIMLSSLSFGADDLEVKLSIYCYRISTVRGAEVLIFKQKNKNDASSWECCTGTLLPNESFKAAGRRIIKNVAGINTTNWVARDYSENKIDGNKTIPVLFMLCKAYSEDKVKLNTDVYSDYIWASFNDIGQLDIEEHLKQELTKLLAIYNQ